MEQGSSPPGGTGYRHLQQVRAYWEGLRCDGMVPNRADVDPRGLEQALEHVFLLERIAPGIAKFRLAGMHLTQLLGMDARGMPLTTFFLPMSRSAIETLLEQAFQSPAIVDLSLEAAREIGGKRLEGKMLLLPLMDDGVCCRALGCLVTQGEIGRRPRRFAIARQRTEAVGPNAHSGAVRVSGIGLAEFAEPAAAFMPQDVSAPRRSIPYLRLVKSDE